MKKLNITKEQFEKSRYFKDKYGTLEYVSESGKMFKTDKGKVLMFKESETSQWIEVDITWGSENDSLPDTVFVKTTLGKMPSRIELECELEEAYEDQILHVDTYPVSEINPSCDCFIYTGNRELTRIAKQEIATMQESSKKSSRKFNEVRDPDSDKWWLGIKYAVEQPNDVYYRGMKLDKDDLFALVNELFEETYGMDDSEFQMWMREHAKEMKYVLREAMVDEWNPEYKEYSVPVWNDTYDGYIKALHLKPYRTQNESSKKFVKESTGSFVEVSAIVKGRGKTIEEAIENFDQELKNMSSDKWDEWSDNYDPETDEYKDRDYWTAEYNKWQEENGGDVDITVVDDRGNAQGFYGYVTISNTDEY